MINWYEEYKKLHRTLTGITILLVIVLILFIVTFRGIAKEIKQKDDKIKQLQGQTILLETKEE